MKQNVPQLMKNSVQPITKNNAKPCIRKGVLLIMKTNAEQSMLMNVREVMCHKQAVPLETLDTVVKAIAVLYLKKFAKLLLYPIVDKLQMNR